ncbi:conserved hypothetical protein [Pediculus humanus corporis]|nr:uncharacterized protein Phum_PHUM537390 [Pediculus humanus corporis]EEB18867.1 conserved hypothetical protein [Pediculus humanus corporis]
MSFSQVNGVPQESKLATYMNHQTSSAPIINSTLTDAIGSISLDSTPSLGKDSVLLVRRDLPSSNSIRPLVATSNGDSTNLNTPPPLRESPVLNSLINDSIVHPAPAYHYQVNQENLGGTTYFYPATTVASESSSSGVTQFQGYAGNHSHLNQEETSLISSSPSFYVSDSIRSEILEKSALIMLQPDPTLYPELPESVDNYHELVPLEPLPIGGPLQIGHSSTYKATHIKTGIRYCLRRIHGFRLSSSKCMVLVDMWKRLSHANIVQLKEVFTTKAFGDNSIVFVHEYHPGSETLWNRHFSSSESTGPTPFSSDPTAPRPYSHTKNTLLRHQHSSMLPENLLWNYIIQITAAVRVIHGAGLACRTLDPSKIIVSSRNRLRISCTGVTDVLTPDTSGTNPLALIPHYQQEDLTALGKLVLALSCKSLLAVQRENIQTSLDLVGRTYSSDLKNLIVYLLHNQKRRTVTDLMPMIGARFYAQLETIQTYADDIENELTKEIDNGRLCRLLAKLGTINERPELSLDPSWSETGDRYMLKLFRDYIFHQVTEDGRPWLEMAHIVQCLNKLDSGSLEKICLMSRDEQSVLVVSYEELKHCLEQSFNEVVTSATEKPSGL